MDSIIDFFITPCPAWHDEFTRARLGQNESLLLQLSNNLSTVLLLRFTVIMLYDAHRFKRIFDIKMPESILAFLLQ
jgi:hypothetical protein